MVPGALVRSLGSRPASWALVVAGRAAARALPLAVPDKISARTAEIFILPLFRAIAIARLAAVCPSQLIAAADAAYYAARAAYTAAYSGMDAPSNAASLAGAAADVVAAGAATDASAKAKESAYHIATAADHATAAAAIRNDIAQLEDGRLTPEQLGLSGLWPTKGAKPPEEVAEAWLAMSAQLRALSNSWNVWISWYDEMSAGSPPAPGRSEEWEMAFTDVEERLPWDDLAATVNKEIARRLKSIDARSSKNASAYGGNLASRKAATLEDLAEITSPQPSLTADGRLDAGPNPTYDIPTVDDDLPTLPIRQRRLISVILDDLPANAPKHLKMCLQSYDDELKARGVQPILGLLKDTADIVAAAVTAPRVEDEWLEPGMRKAFTRFAENHTLFLQHFPLDPKREEIFARIPLDEEKAVGKKLTEPFENVAEASTAAHQAGLTTHGYVHVIEKMTEFARVLATQPATTQPPPPPPHAAAAPRHGGIPTEVRVDPADRTQPVTVRKRSILGALGFFERAYNLAGSSATLAATEQGAHIIAALKDAIASLWNLVP